MAVKEPLEHVGGGVLPRAAFQIDLTPLRLKQIPAAFPIVVGLVFVDEKRLLHPVQRGRDLFIEDARLFLHLARRERRERVQRVVYALLRVVQRVKRAVEDGRVRLEVVRVDVTHLPFDEPSFVKAPVGASFVRFGRVVERDAVDELGRVAGIGHRNRADGLQGAKQVVVA